MNTMKKIITGIAGLSLCCIGLVGLTGCDANNESLQQEQKQEIQISDLQYNENSPEACKVLETILDNDISNDKTTIDNFLTEQGYSIQDHGFDYYTVECSDGSKLNYSLEYHNESNISDISVDKENLKQNIEADYTQLNKEFPDDTGEDHINFYSISGLVDKYGLPYLERITYLGGKWGTISYIYW